MAFTEPAAGSPDAPEAPASETTPPEGTVETLPPGGAPEAFEPDFSDADPFAPMEGEPEPPAEWKAHVQKLRREGGGYRLKAKELKEQVEALAPVAGLFDGWEPEQVEGWKNFLGLAQQDPGSALAAMLTDGFGLDRASALEALNTIYGDGEPGSVPETPPEGANPDDPNRPLTRADLDAIEAQRAQEQAVQDEIAKLHDEVKELGFDPNAKPGSLEEARLQRLFYLTANNGGDTKKAHEALVAEEREAFQKQLDALAASADDLPSVTGNGGPAAPPGGAPKTWDAADDAATAFIGSANR